MKRTAIVTAITTCAFAVFLLGSFAACGNGGKKKPVADTTLLSITTTTPDGAYKAGSNIDITLTFSAPVTLAGGSLNLALDSGAIASINSIASSATATATYTVAAGENSADLDVTAVNLSAPVATLKGTGRKNVILTLPAATFASSHAIVVDTAAPVMNSISSTTANGAYSTGAEINVTVNFNEPVTLAGGNLSIALDTYRNALIAPFADQLSPVATYTVENGDESNALDSTGVSLETGATIVDAAGNACDMTMPLVTIASDSSIVIDTIEPRVESISSASAAGYYNQGDAIDITVTFTEAVTLSGTLRATLDTGDTVQLVQGGDEAVFNGTWIVPAAKNSLALDVVSLALAGAGATLLDDAQNEANLALAGSVVPLADESIVIDTTPPSLLRITSTTANGTYAVNGAINVQLVFSEPVSLTGGNLSVALNANGTNPTVAITPFAVRTSAQKTYTVAPGDSVNDLDAVGLTLAAGAAVKDRAGNPVGSLALPAETIADLKDIRIDTDAPSILSITTTKESGAYNDTAEIDMTVNFSEPVTLAGGSLRLTLNTGDEVLISSIGNATSATATYDVSGGDNVADLDIAAIDLTGGATLRDNVGNNCSLGIPADRFAATKEIAIDTTPPAIESITADTADGTYGINAPIVVRVTFSENVTLAGDDLLITLDTGDTIAIDTFTGADTATATYTVSASDDSADLDATGVALPVTATLRDAAGNNITTPISLPGTTIKTASDIVIDTTAPVVTAITTTKASGSYNDTAAIDITLTFSEAVTLAEDSLKLTLNSGAAVFIPSIAGATTVTATYDVADGENAADLDVTGISLENDATLRDGVGNDFVPSLPADRFAVTKDIVIDTVEPTVTSITSSTQNGAYGQNANIAVAIAFSENVILAGGNLNIKLDTNYVVPITPFAGLAAANGVYSVAAGDNSPDLDAVLVSLGTGVTLRDAAGNNAVIALPGTTIADGSDIVIDTTAPTITAITSTNGNGSYKAGSPIVVRVDFSEPVTLTTGATLDVTLDTASTVQIAPFNGSSASGTYTVLAGQTSPDLNATGITRSGTGTLRDAAGNNVTVALPDAAINIAGLRDIVIDTAAPSIISVTSADANGFFKEGGQIRLTVTFSEPLAISGTLQALLDTGNTVNLAQDTNEAVFTGTYTVPAGKNSPALDVSSFALDGSSPTLTDDAGNGASLSLPAVGNRLVDESIVVDTIVPTIQQITSETADGTYSTDAQINVKVVFSEPVTLAGDDLLVKLNANASNPTVVIAPFTGLSSASAIYTVTGGDNITDLDAIDIDLDGSATLTDAAGNPVTPVAKPANSIAFLKDIRIDTNAPAITSITTTKVTGSYNDSVDIDMTLAFSENVYLAGGSLKLTLNTGAEVLISSISGTATATGTYDVADGQNTADLDITGISLTAGATLEDSVGNPISLGIPATRFAATKDIAIDTVEPVITSITSSTDNGYYNAGDGINVTVTFSEPVSLAAGSTLDVTLDTGSTVSIDPFSGSSSASKVYTVLATQNSADLTATGIGLSVAGTLGDAAGNLVTVGLPAVNQNIAALKNIVVDTVEPTIQSITSTTASGAYKAGSTIAVRVTFSEPVTLAGDNLNVTLDTNDLIAITPFAGANTANATYTVSAGDNSPDLDATVIALAGSATLRDPAGNNVVIALPATTIADGSDIVIDTVAPGITAITSDTADGPYGQNANISVRVTFSENVTLAGGNLNVRLDTNYTAAITPFAGLNTATANYKVSAGENSADLDALQVSLGSGATLLDAAGNGVPMTLPATTISDGSNIVIDTTAPIVTRITSTSANASYKEGSSIVVEVTFNEPVTLTAGSTLDVTLDTGSTVQIAPFSGSTATGTYTVLAGQTSPDLNATGITRSGTGTLRDAAGNNVTVSLPAAINNIAVLKNIVVDTTAPSIVSIASSDANGFFKENGQIHFAVTFTEPLTLSGILRATLDTGDTVDLAQSGDEAVFTGTYLVPAGKNSTALDVTSFALIGSGATLADDALNGASLSLPDAGNRLADESIVVDTIAPAITQITSETGNGTYSKDTNINVKVVFSEPVTLAGDNLIVKLNANASSPTVAITPFTGLSNAATTYAVVNGDNTADLDATDIDLAAGASLTDAAGNPVNPVALPADTIADLKDIRIDTNAPSLVSITTTKATGFYNETVDIDMTVAFSENVYLAGGSLKLTLNTGAEVLISSISGAASATGTYDVLSGENTADLDITGVSLTAGATLKDGVGNDISLGIPATRFALTKDIAIDTVAPTILSITSDTADGSYGANRDITVRVTFSENVTLAGDNLNVTLDTDDQIAITPFAGANTANATYTVSAGDNSPDLDATVIALAGSATLRDPAGNNVVIALPATTIADGSSIVIDTIAPSITTITSGSNNAMYRSGRDISIVVEFSEPVSLSAGSTLDVTLDTGGTASIAPFSGAVSAAGTYTVLAGHTSADLNATGISLSGTGTLQDAAGNAVTVELPDPAANIAALKNIVVDTTAPAISSITSTTLDGSYNEGDEINVTVTFTEPVTLTGGNLSITLDTGDIVSITPFSTASTASVIYHVPAGRNSVHLDATAVSDSGAIIRDTALNPATIALPATTIADGKTIVIDTVAPSIASITSSPTTGSFTVNGQVTVLVNFSERVTLTGGNLEVALDTSRSVLIAPFTNQLQASGVYTVQAGDTSADLDATGITLPVGSITDLAGNQAPIVRPAITIATNSSVVIDTLNPSVVSITSTDANEYFKEGGIIHFALHFSEPVTISGDLVATLDTLNTVTLVQDADESVFNGTYTVPAGKNTPALDVISIALADAEDTLRDDAQNNANLNITALVQRLSSQNIVVDTIPPTIQEISSTTPDNTYSKNAAINVTVEFNEPVTLEGGDIEVTLNAGTNRVAAIHPFADELLPAADYTVQEGDSTTDLDAIGITLTAGSIRDRAGNTITLPLALPGSTIADTSDIALDASRPSIASITASPNAGAYNDDDTIDVTVTFSEAITLVGIGTLDVTLNTTPSRVLQMTVPTGSYVTSATATYTVQDGDNTIAGGSPIPLAAVSVALPGGELQDQYNNVCTLGVPADDNIDNGGTIVIDTTEPTVTEINSTSPDASYKAGTGISIDVTFSEPVTLAVGSTLDVALNSGGTASITPFSGGTASCVYTVLANQNASDLNATGISLSVADSLQDAAGNYLDLQLPAPEDNIAQLRNIVVDTTPPGITRIYSTSDDQNGKVYKLNDEINVTVEFSELVTLTGGGALNVTLNTGDVIAISPIVNKASTEGTYTVSTGDTTADLDSTLIALSNGSSALADAAGNELKEPLTLPDITIADNKDIVVDALVPTIIGAKTLDLDSDGHIDCYKITFSEAMSDATFPGYRVNNTGTSQTQWFVNEYGNPVLIHGTALPPASGETDTANDAILYLGFDEKSIYDTHTKPDLYTGTTPLVQDLHGIALAAMPGTSPVDETDGARPVITEATSESTSTLVTVVFSEVVNATGTGACGDAPLNETMFAYGNVGTGGATSISGMSSDTSACEPANPNVTLVLNAALLDTDINHDAIGAVAGRIFDMAGNTAPELQKPITGAIHPYLMNVSSSGPNKIRVTFSEDMAAAAEQLDTYEIQEASGGPTCSGTGDDEILLSGVTKISGSEYELTNTGNQCTTIVYRLIVDGTLEDTNDHALITDRILTFQGNQLLHIMAAAYQNSTSMVIEFNKDVEAGEGTGGAELESRYMFTGPTDLGAIESAVRSSTNKRQVTITHHNEQRRVPYTVIGANGINGDGFDDATIGAIECENSTEPLQRSMYDRKIWTGYGLAVDTFDYPYATDPFGDTSDFGYLASYNNMVYIGPNIDGNGAARMDANGSNPDTVTFTFTKDASGDSWWGDISENTASSIVSIGHSGCTQNSNDPADGCGPDNEDGRGIFNTGILGLGVNAAPYIFIGGTKSYAVHGSEPEYDYIYYTADTGKPLNFKYIDMDTITGTVTAGLQAMTTLDSRLFAGMAKQNDSDSNAPDSGVITFNNTDSGYCTPGSDCDAWNGHNGKRLYINNMIYFGGNGNNSATHNYARYVGVDVLTVFNSMLYLANGGHNYVNRDGAIIRSNSSNPSACTHNSSGYNGECGSVGWSDITPRTHADWNDGRYSLELRATFDLVPGDRAFSQMAEFHGRLYATRTTCTVTGTDFRDTAEHIIAGCTYQEDGNGEPLATYDDNREAQLWKCDPSIGGDTTACESNEWSLIDGYGSTNDGVTDFGRSDNRTMSMVVANGSYLYVGFDSPGGVTIYRTNVANPVDEDDFVPVGTPGLNGAGDMQQIYSAISIPYGNTFYIYVSAGRNKIPVAVYRNVNQ